MCVCAKLTYIYAVYSTRIYVKYQKSYTRFQNINLKNNVEIGEK